MRLWKPAEFHPRQSRRSIAAFLASAALFSQPVFAGQTSINFDTNPSWSGRFNNLVPANPPLVTQNFGFSASTQAGGTSGELGGTISRTITPAWYAAPIASKTLNDTLTASGRISMPSQSSGGGLHFGWFNNQLQGWRPWSELGFRLDGRGTFANVLLDVMTQNWKAAGINAGNLPTPLTIPFDGSDHTWTLSYNPAGNGTVTFTLDSLPAAVLPLPAGFKADGALFNRFGLLNQQTPSGEMRVYLDDIQYNGVTQNFSNSSTGWEEVGNRVTFPDPEQRGANNFGYRTTNHAGGASAGEVGGMVWRAAPHQEPYYGATVQNLSFDTPMRAAGKVAFRRGASDGGMYFGWFNKNSIENSVDVAPQIASVANFMGVTVEGPSAVGWYFRPIYAGSSGTKHDSQFGPLIYPNLDSHDFEIRYSPAGNSGGGMLVVTLDGVTRSYNLAAGDRAAGANFDRFGLFSLSPDGHFVELFFDDLTYTNSGEPQWLGANGNWHSASQWHGGVPSGAGTTANFLWGALGPTTVFADTPVTVGSMRFDNNHTHVIGGTGSLTIQNNTGNGLIEVITGTPKINLPLTIASNTTLSVASGATLKLSDPVIINVGKVLSQIGSGSVVYESTVTVLSGGGFSAEGTFETAEFSLGENSSARIAPRGDEPIRWFKAGRLSMAPTAVLDLTDNAAVIGQMSTSTALEMIQQGRITSSLTDSRRRLGYRADDDNVLIRFTYAGDSNLDGIVDVADLAALASNWQTSSHWAGGDFDYSGLVDVVDLGLLAGNWQAGAIWLDQALGALGLPPVPVPEPLGAGVSIGAIPLLAIRRQTLRIRQRNTRGN
jgi:hypothetical protein